MRISDWSSDVCSSDLLRRAWHARIQSRAGRPPRQCDQELSRVTRGRCFAHDDDQLRQGTPGRDGFGRGELGAEPARGDRRHRSEEHTSELQSLMRISYAVFCLKKKTYKMKLYTRDINA